MTKFDELESRNDLAVFLDIPIKKMTYVLYELKVDNLYTSFEISKKSGGVRVINKPHPVLKDIQKRLSLALWNHEKSIRGNKKMNISHAFEKEKSIMTNANIHRNKRFVLNIDLEDFFGSFHFGRVRGFFEKNKHFQLPIELATVIAQLTCYKSCLPQGAPTSPTITNLICNILDIKLLVISKKYKLDYTRYADDLTFSTNDKYFKNNMPSFIEELKKEITKSGFKINDSKTRLQFKDSRQEVTGLIVNKKINIKREFYKNTRAMANTLYTTGKFEIEGSVSNINKLEGRFSFINQIEKNQIEKQNNTNSQGKHFNKQKTNLQELSSKEKQYQKFIFYKYFYANAKPVLITEGKTDIKYLEAALKNLYREYPSLITKEDGKFSFKVSFLKKTKRMKYFFGIEQDGADTFTKVFDQYVGSNTLRGYWNFFSKNKCQPSNPVILIFDNELTGKKKPLDKFTNYIKTKKFPIVNEDLQKELHIKILGNLFILTNPLVEDFKECEIEDLFDIETLKHKIEGKFFKRKINNINEQYGKEIFANYISENYEIINFKNFKPMLDSLTLLLEQFENDSNKII